MPKIQMTFEQNNTKDICKQRNCADFYKRLKKYENMSKEEKKKEKNWVKIKNNKGKRNGKKILD